MNKITNLNFNHNNNLLKCVPDDERAQTFLAIIESPRLNVELSETNIKIFKENKLK